MYVRITLDFPSSGLWMSFCLCLAIIGWVDQHSAGAEGAPYRFCIFSCATSKRLAIRSDIESCAVSMLARIQQRDGRGGGWQWARRHTRGTRGGEGTQRETGDGGSKIKS
eukprot:scaffold21510_cov111-Isochrysis_galbana.AAC.1